MANVHFRITITKAIKHYGRKPDGYGGKAALARVLGVSQSALGRWAGPYVPIRHTKTLRDHMKGKR